MQLSDFDYQLPKNLIAQRPAEPRDSSKLMVVRNDHLEHGTFRNLPRYLNKGDVLVLNDSRVLPARLFGEKSTGGKVEVLIVKKEGENVWECLVKGKNIREDTRLFFGGDALKGIVRKKIKGGRFFVEFLSEENVEDFIQKIGKMPTPPYIKETLNEPNKYQTVYSKESGSIAAPTAGLHFTEHILNELKTKGVVTACVTLHVSIGTFLPIQTLDVRKHVMEPEYFKVNDEEARKINLAKKNGKRIFAVGTTTVRALESACDDKGNIHKTKGESDLFIYPGYEFKSGLHGLLTNFHLPKSTLLLLVSAFAGKGTIMQAYEAAKKHLYRFYSFGDAMLILRE